MKVLKKLIMKKVINNIFLKLKQLHDLHNDLPFLPHRMKVKKVQKLVANLYEKAEYVMRIRKLKQALNHRLVLKILSRIIKFKQNVWLKSYIDKKIDLRNKANNDFEKDFFNLINNAAFLGKMENLRKNRGIKLVIEERRRNYLVPEPNYQTTKFSQTIYEQ